jgi:hypothetical protein
VLSIGEKARPGVERMRSATNHSGWLGHRKSQGPNQGDSEGGREFSLPPSLSPRPEPRRHWLGRQLAPLAYGSETPRFTVETTPRHASLSHCSTVLSITVRNWRLMDGSEKLRSAEVLDRTLDEWQKLGAPPYVYDEAAARERYVIWGR